MMMVSCKVGPSKLHGIGVFATEFIKAGTVTWKEDPRIDLALPYPIPKGMFSDPVRRHLEETSYKLADEACQRYPSDLAQFMNHSVTPNCLYDAYMRHDKAVRDIKEGEEITTNYYLHNMKYKPGHFEKSK